VLPPDHRERMHKDQHGNLFRESAFRTSSARMQFCDMDWQPRWSVNSNAVAVYTDYHHASDTLFTVGPCGNIYIPKQNMRDVADKLRIWADAIYRVADEQEA